jgi:hypothetical protein
MRTEPGSSALALRPMDAQRVALLAKLHTREARRA